MDFMHYEETCAINRLGFEGEEWERAAPGEIGRNGEQAKYKLLKPQAWIQPTHNVMWQTNGFHGSTMNYVYEAPGSPTAMAVANMLRAGFRDNIKNEFLPGLLFTNTDEEREYAELHSLIRGYVNENTALFALGDRSLSEWDKYLSEFDKMGLNRYVELVQKAYDNLK
jgi:putative aldouronate transport system substrate-binding protein